MFLVVARAPKPDVVVWTGRRCLACVDAVAWPALAIYLVQCASFAPGIVGQSLVALGCMLAIRRLVRAWVRNERYRFTTLAWARRVSVSLALGVLLKLAAV